MPFAYGGRALDVYAKLRALIEGPEGAGGLFVDLDETLVSTMPETRVFWTDMPVADRRNPSSYLEKHPDTKLVASPGLNYFTRVRPGAARFLTELSSVGPVAILTQGETAFQRLVLRATGLDQFVSEVYGRGFDGVPMSPKNVLIDDTDPHTGVAALKLDVLGIDEGRFFRIKPWDGMDTRDSALQRALPVLKRIWNTPIHEPTQDRPPIM